MGISKDNHRVVKEGSSIFYQFCLFLPCVWHCNTRNTLSWETDKQESMMWCVGAIIEGCKTCSVHSRRGAQIFLGGFLSESCTWAETWKVRRVWPSRAFGERNGLVLQNKMAESIKRLTLNERQGEGTAMTRLVTKEQDKTRSGSLATVCSVDQQHQRGSY